METLLDEIDFGRIALSCHFLDVLCDKAEVHCLGGNSMWYHCPLTQGSRSIVWLHLPALALLGTRVRGELAIDKWR